MLTQICLIYKEENMKTIRFRIDEKSLFYGIYNDFERGQTATVHTPINQAKDPKDWHQDIIELTKYNIELKKVPEMLEKMCLRNTTSQAKSKLNQFFEFKNLFAFRFPFSETPFSFLPNRNKA